MCRSLLSVSFCPGVGEGEGGAKAGEKADVAKRKKTRKVMWKPLVKSQNQMKQLRQNQSRREGEPEHPRQVEALALAREQRHLFQPTLWTLAMSPFRKNPRARA